MGDDWAAGRSPIHPFWIMIFHGIDHAAIEVPPLKQENSIWFSIVMIIIEDPILMVQSLVISDVAIETGSKNR